MSLQVRLRHTLGERLLELPDRPVDEPVVVGRSSAADVQVPSVTVSQRHCVLVVHEGRVDATGSAAKQPRSPLCRWVANLGRSASARRSTRRNGTVASAVSAPGAGRMLRSPRAGCGAAHAWIILAEAGQLGRGVQVGGRLTRVLAGQR